MKREPVRLISAEDIIIDINKLFSDTSVKPEVTLENLEEILEVVEMNIDAIKDDLRCKITGNNECLNY